MKRIKTKGIFCLEGDWEPDLRSKRSVQPLLQLLEHSGFPSVPSIRRDIGTPTELEHYLGKWSQQRYEKYPILYLAFHGAPGVVYIGDRNAHVDLDWLEERLEGRCNGTVIHFGSCATLAAHGKRLNRFLEGTGALAVCGYKKYIDWMISSAFDLLVLRAFQHYSMTRQGIAAVERSIYREIPNLARDLAFRMVISKAKRRR